MIFLLITWLIFFSTLGPGGFHPKIYNTALRLFKEEMLVGCGGGNPDKLTKLCLNRIPEAANEWKRMKSFVSECLTFILIVLLILCIRGVIVSILVEFKCVSMFISNESNLFSQDFCSRRVVVKILKFLLAVAQQKATWRTIVQGVRDCTEAFFRWFLDQ